MFDRLSVVCMSFSLCSRDEVVVGMSVNVALIISPPTSCMLQQPVDHCYYQGQVRGQPTSVAAISSCYGYRWFTSIHFHLVILVNVMLLFLSISMCLLSYTQRPKS